MKKTACWICGARADTDTVLCKRCFGLASTKVEAAEHQVEIAVDCFTESLNEEDTDYGLEI